MLSANSDFTISILAYLRGAYVGWSLSGDSYEGLSWPDDASTPKPSLDQLETIFVTASFNENIKLQIFLLEIQITDRRMREAVLQMDSGWLANINQQISQLRSQIQEI